MCVWTNWGVRGGGGVLGGQKWEPSQHSRQLKGDVKQIPSYGPTNIRRQFTKFSRPGALAGWVSGAPFVEVSFLPSPKKSAKLILFIPHFVLVIIYIHQYICI